MQQFFKFEILAITESHLDNTVLDSALDIDGMKFLRLDRRGRKGGGCVLYYAEHLKVIHRKDLYTPGLEAIWVQVKFTCTSALFAVLYRPPDDNKFFDSVRIPLEKAWLKTSNIFLLGDMNCNLSTVKYSAHGVTNKYKLQSIMDDFHMHNVITEPTRRTITSCTLIDVIITTRKELVSSAGVFLLGISDHDLIYATIHLKNKRPPPKITRTRNYKRNRDYFMESARVRDFHTSW